MADFLGYGPGIALGPWWEYEIRPFCPETILYARPSVFALQGQPVVFSLQASPGYYVAHGLVAILI